MSKSIRTEKDRRIAELEALVAGQAVEIGRLTEALDKCEQLGAEMALALQAAKEGAP